MDIDRDIERNFTLQVGPPWRLRKNDRELRVCLRMEEGAGAGELHPVEWVRVTGTAIIRVSEVPLEHRRLGEVTYAYGEGRVGEQEALLVASEGQHGGKLTVRFRGGAEQTDRLDNE